MEGEAKPVSGSNSNLDNPTHSTEDSSPAVGSGSEGMNELPCLEKTTNSDIELAEEDLHQWIFISANGGDASLTKEVKLPIESQPGEVHGPKNEPSTSNGDCSGYNNEDTKPDDTPGLPGISKEVDDIRNPDSKDKHQHKEYEVEALKMEYDCFVQGIVGCLDELRNTSNDLDGEGADKIKSSGDDGREIHELPDSMSTASGESGENGPEYFEPTFFEAEVTIPNNKLIPDLDELNHETCSKAGVQEAAALNGSNPAVNGAVSCLTPKIDANDNEHSVFSGIEELPIDQTDHTHAMIDVGTLQTQSECSIFPYHEYSDSTTIDLPIPENLREHRWLLANASAFKLGTSGFSYIGGIADGKMQGFGRLMLGDGGQFMEGIWTMNRLEELHSCWLTCDPGNQIVLIFRRQNDYLLTMFENHYVARVIFNKMEDLDLTHSVAHFKRDFFRKLIVLELVADELEDKNQASLNKFATLLANTIGVDADPIFRANTFILLSLYLRNSDKDLTDILRDSNIPGDVKAAAADLLDCERCYLSNTYVFANRVEKLRLELRKVLAKIYNDGIARYRQMLIDKCPSALPNLSSSIRSLPESKIVYITCEDMRVFDHLVSQPCFEHYTTFFENLVERFNHAIHNIKTHSPSATVIPVISPVYGFIFKSFWEIVSEIVEVVGCYEYKDMLKYESGDWKLQESISWPESDVGGTQKQQILKLVKSSEKKSTTLLHRLLEIQYKFLFHMLKYFSPENFIVKRKYEFDFHVLEQDLSWWEKGLKTVKQKVGLSERLENLTTERIVWLCLLDHSIHEVFKGDPRYQILLKPYSALFQGHISLIEKSGTESHETFRVMTHSIVKFVTSTAPYFREAQGKPGVDVEILVQQMWTISTASQEIDDDPTTFSNFRDLITEYNRYLSLRLFINIEATSGYFSAHISQLMQTFMRIVVTSLKKSVPTAALVGYLRSLNDFLDDFKNIDFLAIWFVKSDFFDPKVLEKVNNKLSDSGNCSYRVIDIEKYVQVVQILGNQPIPPHYIIQVVGQLLNCIEVCLDKQWELGNVELQVTQLECTGLILDATRKSFMYLKEQPDYVDFDTFKKESVDPFVCLVHGCVTLSDLKTRTGKVSASFWYIRKMDVIGIDRALKMFTNANTCDVSNKLLESYNLYLRNYDEHISKYRSVLSDGKSHEEGLGEVIRVLDKTSPMHFSMWTEDFKIKEIPVILAGLSAVWSILTSKDVSRTGKFLKPHCVQILCILRLLSVDLSNSANNHLAQVLTGQGKSVILGLLSSILALTGHNVRVLCYSEYLSTRDQGDCDEFFKTFKVIDKIKYGTFENMANSFVNPISNGRQSSLCQLVKERVLNHTNWPSVTHVTPVSKDTVLLIDEVDVFFTDQFYGNGVYPCTLLGFEGLASVHKLIWSLTVNNPNYSSIQIAKRSRKLIANGVAAGNGPMLEFNAFLSKPGTFTLLTRGESGSIFVKTYTNRSLFDEHLLEMVDDAWSVRNRSWARSGYAMSVNGVIMYKDNNTGIYSTSLYPGYRNIFNYFRLKGSNYDTKNFTNYGYLNVVVGEVSYARLPLQFQLILGVSGTLTNLGEYEKRGIKFYDINNFSVLPSFFGESNLQFNTEIDFHCFRKEQDWLKEIYVRANSIVELRRAVLIFFKSDDTMNMFSKEYKTKFDRMHEMTENTDGSLRDAFIEEAGLPCTVTLATRGMGRGVDYKSSLSVEKNGGVHVIQTFYSLDVKEEVQIKGRTARKDNKGSYELIICRHHLVRDKTILAQDDTVHNYSSLDRIRKYLSNRKGETVYDKIRKCERNHTTTMKYFGLM